MSGQMREYVAAFIAAVLVVAYCVVVVYGVLSGRGYSVPDAFLAIVVSVVSYFFGSHASTNGAYTAGHIAADAAASAAAQAATTTVTKAP